MQTAEYGRGTTFEYLRYSLLSSACGLLLDRSPYTFSDVCVRLEHLVSLKFTPAVQRPTLSTKGAAIQAAHTVRTSATVAVNHQIRIVCCKQKTSALVDINLQNKLSKINLTKNLMVSQ